MEEKKLLFLVSCTLLSSVLAIPLSEEGSTEISNDVFSAVIECSSVYILGNEIACQMNITNIGYDDYYLLKWQIPLNGVPADIFTVARNAEVIPYDGILVRRARPSNESFILVPVGDTVSVKFDLSEAYSINASGVYTVELNTTIEYYPTNGSMNSRLQKCLRSSPVTFQVVGYGPPRLTLGENARQMESNGMEQESTVNKPPNELLQAPCYQGFTENQEEICVNSHNKAFTSIAKSIKGVDRQMLYETWFGDPGAGRRKKVKDCYKDMHIGMCIKKITYKPGDDCRCDTIAYVYPCACTVYICPLFWELDAKERACTIVHEMSHIFCKTKDYVYGTKWSKNLAKIAPTLATNNAENYCYFSVELCEK